MLSRNQARFINSLSNKRLREKSEMFVVEGEKMVRELIDHKEDIKHLFALKSWFEENKNLSKEINQIEVTDSELKKVSKLSTPNRVLAVVGIPGHKLEIDTLKNDLSLALDNIQDPGNLGTIIRIADWMGIEQIICSHGTVDCYNSKVVQSAMGSLMRVKVHYAYLEDTFPEIKKAGVCIYGAHLSGKSIYKSKLKSKGSILLIGNESQGIQDELLPFIDEQVKIPSYSKSEGAESLNAAVATGILCSEFRRLG